jgi:hypothetical protein
MKGSKNMATHPIGPIPDQTVNVLTRVYSQFDERLPL